MTIPYWGTHDHSLLGENDHLYIEGQMTIHYWGTNDHPLVGDKFK